MQDMLALVTHNVVALRAAPDGDSEQVSQAILGETVVCLAEQDDHIQVRTGDGYEGWIWRGNVWEERGVGDRGSGVGEQKTKKSAGRSVSGLGLISLVFRDDLPWPFCLELSDGTMPAVRYVNGGIVDLYAAPDNPLSLITKLVMGTWLRVIDNAPDASVPMLKVVVPFNSLPLADETANPAFLPPAPVLISGYVKAADTLPAAAWGYQGAFSGSAVCALAQRFIGTPYLWGGTTPFGFDCSGYVQCVYKLHNIVLPRDAYMQSQSALGVMLAAGAPLMAGDLVFFCSRSDPRKRGITHVGMALDAERFSHAYGKQGVVITRFDDPACRANYTYMSAWRYHERSR